MTDFDALASRLMLLEARFNAIDQEPVPDDLAVDDSSSVAPVAPSVTLTILDTPVVLVSGSGGSAWSTESGGGTGWPLNATHVYLSAAQRDGVGSLQLRKDSSVSEFSVCGSTSANNYAVACAFVNLSSSSTFDWRNTANNDYSLTLVGYIS